jgi:hypothetical protein
MAVHERLHALGQETRLLHAIIHGHSPVGVAADEEPRMTRKALIDPGDPFKVPEEILRNGAVPADNVVEYGRSPHTDRLR